jgi:hypothetical protein
MHRRSLLSALAAVAVAAAACADQTPTLPGDDRFPAGAIPVTREVLIPASEFFRVLGSFSGYTTAAQAPFVVVANDYEGLDAHALARFVGFPMAITYRVDGVERRDTVFQYSPSRMVARVDTLASTPGPVTIRVWEAVEGWDPRSATWEMAVDTAGNRTPWTEPGGTRGELLAEATFTREAGTDSLVIPLSAAAVTRLADTLSRGVVVTAGEPGSRVELADLLVRALVRPEAAPDTTLVFTIPSVGLRTTVYTPEQPDPPPGALAAGGIRSARTLVDLDPRVTVPGCAAGEVCAAVPLRDVRLNDVALLLRPVDVPGGFDPLGRIPLTLRLVEEPELGRFAPLGQIALERDAVLAPGDTVVALPLTALTATLLANDTLPTTFALVSQQAFTTAPASFGVAFFDGEPWLRIVYTLPSRRRLP